MKNPEVFEKSDSLKSGNFYAVNAIQRCYRINEPDHFLKDMETNLVGYFDKEEQFHHFNRLQSRQAAKTSLYTLLSLNDLKSLEFYQLRDHLLEEINNDSLELRSVPQSERATVEMVKKTVASFFERSESDCGIIHSVEELKRKHLKEYLAPPDLAH